MNLKGTTKTACSQHGGRNRERNNDGGGPVVYKKKGVWSRCDNNVTMASVQLYVLANNLFINRRSASLK